MSANKSKLDPVKGTVQTLLKTAEISQKDIRPSDFLRYLGFTHGAWLTFVGPVYFLLSRMDEMGEKNELYIGGGEEDAGFFHPDISTRLPGAAWWEPRYRTKNGILLRRPIAFVKTSKGYGIKEAIDVSGPDWKYETHLFGELIENNVMPIFDGRHEEYLILNYRSKAFLQEE